MSLRWHDRIDAALSPGALDCSFVPRGWRTSVPQRMVVQCTATAAQAPWRAAVDALAHWLAKNEHAGAALRVVLSDHFARYAVLPWHAELTAPAEREALARHLFADKYGVAAADWSVQLAPARFGHPTIICAVDRALHDALRTLATQHRLQLGSMQTLLARHCDTHAARLGRQAALFVHEAGRLSCAVVRDGVWADVRSLRPGQGAWRDAWLVREVEVMGLETTTALYLADETGAAVPSGAAPYRLLTPHGNGTAQRLWATPAGVLP